MFGQTSSSMWSFFTPRKESLLPQQQQQQQTLLCGTVVDESPTSFTEQRSSLCGISPLPATPQSIQVGSVSESASRFLSLRLPSIVSTDDEALSMSMQEDRSATRPQCSHALAFMDDLDWTSSGLSQEEDVIMTQRSCTLTTLCTAFLEGQEGTQRWTIEERFGVALEGIIAAFHLLAVNVKKRARDTPSCCDAAVVIPNPEERPSSNNSNTHRSNEVTAKTLAAPITALSPHADSDTEIECDDDDDDDTVLESISDNGNDEDGTALLQHCCGSSRGAAEQHDNDDDNSSNATQLQSPPVCLASSASQLLHLASHQKKRATGRYRRQVNRINK
eukprot:PhM_4_TR12387/c0_g1_i1/m.61626